MWATVEALARAVSVRIGLSIHALLVLYRVYRNSQDNSNYWILLTPLILLWIECVFVIVRRKSEESKWVSWCVLLYLGCTIPGVWLLEHQKRWEARSGVGFKSFQLDEGIVSTKYFPDVMEQLMLFVVIAGHWILPREQMTQPDVEMTRDDLSNLLMAYMTLALDITEIFSLLGETQIQASDEMTYSLLFFWTLSVLQFTINLAATKSIDQESPYRLATECWSLILTVTLQDIPFLILRCVVLFHYQLVTYTIITFILKNVFMMVFLAYRLWVVYYERMRGNF